jgi:hypothetical protein
MTQMRHKFYLFVLPDTYGTGREEEISHTMNLLALGQIFYFSIYISLVTVLIFIVAN